MRKWMMAPVFVGALALAGSAAAQDEFDPTPYGFGFRIGGAAPQDAAVRGTKDFWNAIGVDYNFNTSILGTGTGFLSADLFSTEFAGEGDTMWSLMVGNRFAGNAENGLYFVGGLGALFTDFADSKASFGAMAGAGIRFGQAVFIEGRYTYGRKVDGLDPSTIAFYLGYRF